jgi:DNA repair ATPase RecN
MESTRDRVALLCERTIQCLHQLYKEPYVAIYRVLEHCYRRLPHVIGVRMRLEELCKQVSGAQEDLESVQKQTQACLEEPIQARLHHMAYLASSCRELAKKQKHKLDHR